jgi:hypothetical protein
MLCVLAGVLFLHGSLWAENLRVFPADAKPATFNGFVDNGVKLGSRVSALAPGLQIRDRANLIVVPATLNGVENLPVRVQLDTQGAVWRIWILTPEEAAKR